jgi:hypothetical protein
VSDTKDQTIWSEQETLKRADEICGNAVALLQGTTRKALDERSSAERNAARKEMTIRDVLPRNAEQMLDDIEMKQVSNLDDQCQALAMDGVLKPLLELEPALERATAHHQVLRPSARYTTPLEQMTARRLELAEREEARVTMAGKTLGELTRIYKASSDVDRGAFVAFIEEEQSLGFPTLNYTRTTSVDDVAAMVGLSEAIAARKDARTPLYIKEVRARLAATLDDSSRKQIQQIGRGNVRPATDHFKASVTARERARAERVAV